MESTHLSCNKAKTHNTIYLLIKASKIRVLSHMFHLVHPHLYLSHSPNNHIDTSREIAAHAIRMLQLQ